MSKKRKKKRNIAPTSIEAGLGDGEQEELEEVGIEVDTPQNSPCAPVVASPSSLKYIFRELNTPPTEIPPLLMSDVNPSKEPVQRRRGEEAFSRKEDLKEDEKEAVEEKKSVDTRVSGYRKKRGMSDR